MTLIFINSLTNIVSDAGEYHCVIDWSLAINETQGQSEIHKIGLDKLPRFLIIH